MRPESTATFSVEAAGQVHNQTNEFVYLGGNVNQNADLSIEVNRRIRNAWSSFRKYTLERYDRPSAPLELKIRMLRAEVFEIMLYGCVTRNPRACQYETRCAWRIRDYRNVIFRELVGGAGCVGDQEKEWAGCFPDDLRAFGIKRRPVDDCSPGRGGMAQDGGTRGGTFNGERDRCRESQGWTTVCSSMPERDRKDQGEVAQSKRARAGSVAIVD